MNAIEDNQWAPVWRKLGEQLGEVKGVLCVSAHWYTGGCGVTAMTAPKTIHDFGGFPQELFNVQYPAPGDPELARTTKALLANETDVVLDQSWGLDHGTWSLLVHLFPEANIPVVQLSIDSRVSNIKHMEYGRRIQELREMGYLILGSGNVVHNLRESFRHQGQDDGLTWAKKFEGEVRSRLEQREFNTLAEYDDIDDSARLSVPTPEHYLPMLYVLGAADESEQVKVVADGFQWGGISMLGIQVG